MAVCSQICKKHISTLRGQKVELLNVKPGSIYSDHLAIKGLLNEAIKLCVEKSHDSTHS
jgi:hypothetical protein